MFHGLADDGKRFALTLVIFNYLNYFSPGGLGGGTIAWVGGLIRLQISTDLCGLIL